MILLLSILGFLNAFYIFYQHKREVQTGQKMFCLMGRDCGEVVGSKYGKTFGVKNEKIGMICYFLVGFYSLMVMFFPGFGQNFWILIKIGMGFVTVFSLYLLYVQTVVLKKICSWCLIAIIINLLIFSLY